MSRSIRMPNPQQQEMMSSRMVPGGELYSESPIRRRNRLTGMAKPLEYVELRPTVFSDPELNDGQHWFAAPYTGGVDCLADGSDSTAVHLRTFYASPTSYGHYRLSARFGAVDVPADFVPNSMHLILRAKEVGTMPNIDSPLYGYTYPQLNVQLHRSDWNYYASAHWFNHYYTAAVPPLASTYQTWDSRDNRGDAQGNGWSQAYVPSSDDIRNGVIDLLLEVYWVLSTGHPYGDAQVDLSEVTLIISSGPA